MDIKNIIDSNNKHTTIVAVSKTKPIEKIQKIYNEGQIDFGENRVNELIYKYQLLPKNINWHMIGHLQRNKVKLILPFIHLIHSVDSIRLINKIENESKKINKKTNILLQIHIAQEETKYGFTFSQVKALFNNNFFNSFEYLNIKGFMGMSTFTNNKNQIRKEFNNLKVLFDEVKSKFNKVNKNIIIDSLSMGMSGDYKIALEEGSNIIRIGSLIFGERE